MGYFLAKLWLLFIMHIVLFVKHSCDGFIEELLYFPNMHLIDNERHILIILLCHILFYHIESEVPKQTLEDQNRLLQDNERLNEELAGTITITSMASQIASLMIVYSRHRSKNTSKFHVTGLCERNSPVTDEFPTQRASNEENVSIWWRHHDECSYGWIIKSHNSVGI